VNPTLRAWTLLAATALACGSSHPSDPPCPAGTTCTAPIYVACYATNEVRGTTRDLQDAGVPRTVGQGPASLFLDGDTLWVATAGGAPEVDAIVAGAPATPHVLASGQDLEFLRVHQGRVYVSNSFIDTVTVRDAKTGDVVDEVSLSEHPGDYVNPRGIDFVGSLAYVALPGTSAANASFAIGQEVAVVDFSGARGAVVNRISMNVSGASDTNALPFPYHLVASGTKVYVALANYTLSAPDPKYGSNYVVPAGSGRLAVIDTAANDAVSVTDLGASCQVPNGLALEGSTLWVSCGSGAVVPVSIAGTRPVVGSAIPAPTGFVPGNLAVCRGTAYVTDLYSGGVLRFDTTARVAQPVVAVCPTNQALGYAFAADVACAP
jgi:hypothetical protein